MNFGNGSSSSSPEANGRDETTGEHGRDDRERIISSSLARFPKRFLVSSSSDGFLHLFVGFSTSRLVISLLSSSSSNDKSKSVSSDELSCVDCMNFIGRRFKLLFSVIVDNVQTLSTLDNRLMKSTAVIPLLTSSSER